MSFLVKTSDVAAIIPARNGSRGLPNKNLLNIAGQPLIQRAIDQALRLFENVIVTTDIPEILKDEMLLSCERITIIERPDHLATDSANMNDVLGHVIAGIDSDVKALCLMQTTSPLRSDMDIQDALEAYKNRGSYGDGVEMVMSGVEKDPSALKHGIVIDGVFEYFARGKYANSNRQMLPKVIGPNGAIYVFSKEAFLLEAGLPKGKIGIVEMPKERSIDIDTVEDLKAAIDFLNQT